MKIAAMTMMAGLAAMTAQAAERDVTVCMEGRAGSAESTASKARAIAAKMFAGIGVTINWRLRDCTPPAILITITGNTPATMRPGALAYALPYEGAHIRVFYDRIAETHEQALVPNVLAHVLVHEIAHVLQRIGRHSDRGVMKAHWDEMDYAQMRRESLSFTDEDIHLIHQGLAIRATQ